MWLGGLAILLTLGGSVWVSLVGLAEQCWSRTDVQQQASGFFSAQLAPVSAIFWTRLLPVLAGIAGMAVIGIALQTRFGIFPDLLQPNWNRVNPVSNLARLRSPAIWSAACLGLVKLVLLTLLAWWVLAGDIEYLLALGGLDLEVSLGEAGNYTAGLMIRLAAGACLAGMVDYGVRWWECRQRMRMTDQELRDEQRATEAPPEIEARRRLITREDGQ